MTTRYIQWNTPVYCSIPEEKRTRIYGASARARTNTRTHACTLINIFRNDYFNLCYYPPPSRCIYLSFLDSRFRFELRGRVRRTWQTATELDRPCQTLVCRPTTDNLQVVLRYDTFCHVLKCSRRSTTAYLSSLTLKLCPSDHSNPVPLNCVTVTPYRPWWPKSWLPGPPGI